MVERRYSQRIFEVMLAVMLACVGVFGGIFGTTQTGAANLNARTTVNVVVESSDLPIIDSISPDRGPTSGGDTITITGDNFDNVTEVIIGGSQCTDLVIVDSHTITCTVPPGAEGSADVTLVTSEGWSRTKDDGYTYYDDSEPPIPPKPQLPLPPATGLFTLGGWGTITNYDIMFIIAGLLVLGGVIFLMVHSSHKGTKQASKGKSTKKPVAKRKKARK